MSRADRRSTALFVVLSLIVAFRAAPVCVHAQARTELVLWHAYGPAEAAGLYAAIAEFEATHPDVHVQVLHVAFDAYFSKLTSAIPTGNGPDVFIDAHERLASFLENGVVGPWPADAILRAAFEPQALAALEREGRLYGVPLALKCAALYLNRAWVPEPPASLEELEALRATLPPSAYPLVLEAENSYYAAAFLHGQGGRFLDANGNYGFIGPAAERAIATLQSFVRTGLVPEETNGDLVRQLFASGRAQAAISGPWLAPELPATLDWYVVPLPAARRGGAPLRPFLTIEALMLARNAHNPGAAMQLAEFLSMGPGAAVRARVGKQVVAVSVGIDEVGETLAVFRTAASAAIPMPTHPNMRATFEPTTRALRKVLRGDAPIAEALDEAARRFSDATRPLPDRTSPTPTLLALGLFLLLGSLSLVRRLRRPAFRAAVLHSLPAYRYLVHAAIVVLALVVVPLTAGFATSFFAMRGEESRFVGLANYADILSARGGGVFATGSFWLVLAVTLLWTVCNLVGHVGLGVALALLLHRPAMLLKTPYRVLLILPWAVPNYVTALAWKGMFHRQFGAMNALLESLGADAIGWFGQWSSAFTANLLTNLWLGFPFMMVVSLGALAAIPRDLYEAAAVDGASPWQRFRWITAPMLVPMLAPAVAMGAIWTFNSFNVVFLVSGGEPDGTTEILVSEAYRWAFARSSQYGYAAAYAVLIFIILLIGTRRRAGRLDAMGSTA